VRLSTTQARVTALDASLVSLTDECEERAHSLQHVLDTSQGAGASSPHPAVRFSQ